MDDLSTAVLIMNHDYNNENTITINFSSIPSFADADPETVYLVRDIWAKQDIAKVQYNLTFQVPVHDSVFLKITRIA